MMDRKNWFFLVIIVIANTSFEDEAKKNTINEDTLLVAHVIFRHGDRTPDTTELYPNDPYINETYFPYGRGQLTKIGKRREYNIGKSLRKRYGYFLGKHYYAKLVESVTTDYERTKISLQLVLAGLFPPIQEEIWDINLPWQPIPYNYAQKENDKVLLGTLCQHYLELYENVTISRETQQKFKKYKNLFDYISLNSGLNVSRFLDVYKLYFGLFIEEDLGLTLPRWTNNIWPQLITDLAVKEYFLGMSTPEMKQITAGNFIKKIIEDTRKNILSSNTLRTKMHLYSAHENNIAHLLIALGVFEPHVPKYGSYVLIEAHYIDKIFGLKFYYENYKDEGGPKLLNIPMCSEFCPLEKFLSLFQDIIPKGNIMC